MKNDIDDLLNSVFTRKRDLDTEKILKDMEKANLDLSRMIDEQSAALHNELMRGKISGEKAPKEAPEPEKDPLCAFDGIADEVKKKVFGQDEFVRGLCIAFKRPFVMGISADKPKNTILVLGKKGSGRHTAVNTLTELLFMRGAIKSGSVHTVDLSLYQTQTAEKVFLQDLYTALTGRAEVLLFEGFESCHPGFLNVVKDIAMEGRSWLNSRYVMQKGMLVDAGNALVTGAVGELSAGGKYLVFITKKGRAKVADAFGAPFVAAMGDVLETGVLSEESILEIAKREQSELKEKSKKQLKITVEGDICAHLAKKFGRENGAFGISEYADLCYKALSQFKLEQEKNEPVTAKMLEKDGTLTADFGAGEVPLLSLLPSAYSGDIAEVKAEIEQIVGLTEIKNYILALEDNYRVQNMRRAQGMKTMSPSMHMIFTGNPGTGKTTIARLVSKYLKAIGVLSGGQLVEVTRADLVGKYVGHTAPLTTQVIKSAIGGVLFIDEAYSLYRGKDDSFGLEAIDTLVKCMEDYRDSLIVILAGYTREMQEFLTANSGLKSRFPNIIEFPDYSGEELFKIAEIQAKSKGYRLEEACSAPLLEYFTNVQALRAKESGNGRLARNKVEEAILNQSKRVIREENPVLDELKLCDFELVM